MKHLKRLAVLVVPIVATLGLPSVANAAPPKTDASNVASLSSISGDGPNSISGDHLR